MSAEPREALAIVGGGPAGIATALFFAHAAPDLADRVVVLEKERYPREKFCAGAIGARGDRVLGSIGVTVDVPSVWVSGVAFRAMGRTVEVRDGVVGRVVRRLEYDQALALEARSRGIRVVEGARVVGVRPERARIGVDLANGRTLWAALVAGADGVQSVVRRALGLGATRWSAQALEVDTEVLDGDLARDVLVFDASRRELPGYYWDFPTVVDGHEMTCRGVYLLRTPGAPRLDLQAILDAELQARGLEPSRYRRKRYAERGFEPAARVSGHRVVLVGEAAGIDPITGEGIAQALHYGATAGRYLARKHREGDGSLSDWPREIRRHHVGRDLLVRTLGAPLFYGARRPAIERFLLDAPEFIRVGLQHFAGKPWSRTAIARAAVRAVAHTARAALVDGS